MSGLPVVDLAPLRSGGAAGLRDVAAAVGAACRGPGFFYAVNHGVPHALIGETFSAARAFFAEPPDVKAELAMDRVGGNRGYVGVAREALDPAQGRDAKEAFNIGLDLAPDDPGLVAGEPFRALNAWPPTAKFRATTLAYFDACLALGGDLMRAVACDLGLPETFFADKFERSLATLRLLRYPPEPKGTVGAGAHTDYGALTLLATDAVGGLEVRARGGWIEAPPMPGAFVVNIGDCLMRWTNDLYVSTPHRVVSRGGPERFSFAFFYDPNPFARVEAAPSCVAPGEAPRHAPILAHDYLRSRFEATYAGRG